MSDEAKKCECCPDCEAMVGGQEKVNDSWFWIKDTKGYGSVTVTFVTVAFWVTTVAYMLSMAESVGPISIRPFDVAACSSYFIPILTLYFGRKWTDAKFKPEEK